VGSACGAVQPVAKVQLDAPGARAYDVRIPDELVVQALEDLRDVDVDPAVLVGDDLEGGIVGELGLGGSSAWALLGVCAI